jgi:hypothetical protein
MPQISKQQIEQVIASLHCDAEETKLDEVAKMMKSLLDQPEVESVGIVVSSSHQQVQWAAGIDVKALDGTKLYIHPPAPLKMLDDDEFEEVWIESSNAEGNNDEIVMSEFAEKIQQAFCAKNNLTLEKP